MNEKDNNSGAFQLDLPADVAQGNYANFAIITHSSSDFIVDFARVLPGLPAPVVKRRGIRAPWHAKRVRLAWQESIMLYEHEFGTITIPNQEPRTISPFNVAKGEA